MKGGLTLTRLGLASAAALLLACGYSGSPAGSSLAPGGPGPASTPVTATLGWAPATGPVTGYRVFESRNGGAFMQSSEVPSTSVEVSGQPGDTLRIRVAGLDAMGNAGPLSPASDLLTFQSDGVTMAAASGGTANATADTSAAVDSASALSRQVAGASAVQAVATTDGSDPLAKTQEQAAGATRLDMDGDGATDLLWESVSEPLLRVTNTAHEVLAVFDRPAPAWELVGLADFDGDGLTDLLWANDAGDLALTRMAPTLAGQPALDFGAVGSLGADELVLATGDFDGDGRAEVLVGDSAGAALSIWSLASGAAPELRALGRDIAPGQVLAGSRDYDGDGIDDLLFQAPDGSLSAWLLDASGVRGAAPIAATAGGEVVASGDFDGDGVADIARRDAAGAVDLLLLGAGLDAPALSGGLPDAAALSAAGAGDYDGDGRTDLLWQDAAGAPVLWFLDPGQAVATEVLPADTGWALVPDWR